jgi:hypothetical protein
MQWGLLETSGVVVVVVAVKIVIQRYRRLSKKPCLQSCRVKDQEPVINVVMVDVRVIVTINLVAEVEVYYLVTLLITTVGLPMTKIWFTPTSLVIQSDMRILNQQQLKLQTVQSDGKSFIMMLAIMKIMETRPIRQ